MCAAPVATHRIASEILEFASAFAARDRRPEAVERLARTLGGTGLHIFSRDPELGVLLPAPGLPQNLPDASAWRDFLERCVRGGAASGMLPLREGSPVRAAGVAGGDAVAVLTGDAVTAAAAAELRPLLPLLGALFRAERQVFASEVHARAADEAVERSRLFAGSLNDLRHQLEIALGEAEASRQEARERAEHAELLAEELRSQAAHLEEQAGELEVLNRELSLRSEEAEKARHSAEEANRAKSEFLANMSHELRTPINAVLGFEELLAMEIAGPLNEVQLAQLERIRSSGQHLLTLINDILDLAKVEAGQLSIVHEFETLAPVLDEATSIVKMLFDDRGVVLEHACPDPTPVYYGDRDRVRQILINLLSNAVKFTEPGGSVTVDCGVTDRPASDAALGGSGRWTFVHVADTGIGIAPDDVARIFQPFGQVEQGRTRKQGGTGLGLTISRQLARLMGGDLTLRSELGVGSHFSLWLPADKAVYGQLDPTIRIPDQ